MIDDISGGRLVVHTNDRSPSYLMIADSQKPKIEAILKENGYAGDWSPSVSAVEQYSDSSDSHNMSNVVVWSVFLGNVDVNKLQDALDAAM